MAKLNIGMILDNEFTGDMRVENEVMSLSKAGYKVFVLCLTHGDKPEEEDFHGAKIVRMPISLFQKNKMKGLTLTLFDPWTPWWTKKLMAFVKKYNIDAIHAHDMYMVGAALKVKEKMGLPVVADLHENYPEALKHYKYVRTFPGKYIISIPKWERMEVVWTKQADQMITVIEEACDRYKKLGVPAEKINVVQNYVNREVFLSEKTIPELNERFKDKFVALYAGGFDIHRGLEALVRALPIIRKDVPNFMLVLVGKGINSPDLKQMAAELQVEDMVSFEGWQPPSDLPAYCSMCDVALIPHLKTNHTDNTIPHKLFHYMLLGRPVISTNCNPLERIVKDAKSGLIYESDNSADFAKQVITMYNDPEATKIMGESGKAATIDRYTWDEAAKNLNAVYAKVEKTLNKA